MGIGSSKKIPPSVKFDIIKKGENNRKYLELNNKEKTKCPLIGLGTGEITDDNVVYQSIVDGVRLIDTEPSKKEIVGQGIKRALDEKKVKREELFIVTKLELEEKENPEEALRKSLKRLQLDYVDLYLDHWPSCISINNKKQYKLIPVRDTWKEMEKLYEMKLTKAIGISNYNVGNIFNILSICKYKPAVNEVEFHPFLYQKDLKDFCDKEQIVLFAYYPLAKGHYADEHFNLFKEKIVKKAKNENNVLTEGQIILNWHISQGVVPIPGTSKPNRMKDNLGALKYEMKPEYIELLGRDEENQKRFNDGSEIFGINIFA